MCNCREMKRSEIKQMGGVGYFKEVTREYYALLQGMRRRNALRSLSKTWLISVDEAKDIVDGWED